jgi:hypothetical protein
MQTARKQGMLLLNDALADLVKRKIITSEEAWMKALDKAGLASAFKPLGIEAPSPVAAHA